jgi:hypothetical protein
VQISLKERGQLRTLFGGQLGIGSQARELPLASLEGNDRRAIGRAIQTLPNGQPFSCGETTDKFICLKPADGYIKTVFSRKATRTIIFRDSIGMSGPFTRQTFQALTPRKSST